MCPDSGSSANASSACSPGLTGTRAVLGVPAGGGSLGSPAEQSRPVRFPAVTVKTQFCWFSNPVCTTHHSRPAPLLDPNYPSVTRKGRVRKATWVTLQVMGPERADPPAPPRESSSAPRPGGRETRGLPPRGPRPRSGTCLPPGPGLISCFFACLVTSSACWTFYVTRGRNSGLRLSRGNPCCSRFLFICLGVRIVQR